MFMDVRGCSLAVVGVPVNFPVGLVPIQLFKVVRAEPVSTEPSVATCPGAS